MPNSLYVKPSAPDLGLRDPVTRAPLPEDGGCVPDSAHWRRRLKNGDVVELPAEEHAAAVQRTHAALRGTLPAAPDHADHLVCIVEGKPIEVDADMLQLLVNENTDLREQVKHTADALRARLESKAAEIAQLRAELEAVAGEIETRDAELSKLRAELEAATAPTDTHAKAGKGKKKGA